MLVLQVGEAPAEGQEPPGPDVTIRFPFRFLEVAVDRSRPLDVAVLIDEMKNAGRGDVVELTAEDAHIRVWLE